MLLFPYLQQGRDNSDVGQRQVWDCPANDQIEAECGYGFNTNLNWVSLSQIRKWSETVALCDSGIRDGNQLTLSTMCQPPSKTSTAANPAYRPNPRHPNKTVNVGFVDGHVEPLPMTDPFYPGPVDKWSGNGVTNSGDSAYKDWLWDLE
jgi:prepilin-type processing-associated H-X9-DG protein